MSANSAAILIGLSNVVGANRHVPTISNVGFVFRCNQTFSLAAVFGAESPAGEGEDHWILSLQLGKVEKHQPQNAGSRVEEIVIANGAAESLRNEPCGSPR